MHKILAFSILAFGISGAVLMSSIPPLFESPIRNGAKMFTAGSAVAFVIVTVLTFVIRRLFDKEQLAKKSDEKRE
ncbi:hypothetical protein [Baia soyae]|uniref:Uncharacterized protein n=1 Tax=Baia soyae TaxID=1544746 RepID=A0A4R2RL45_9BACL|nr:hypothetical protein [Baia soyae]TCP63654.1 hypothetical protein EDD57_14819 [Baia soyae]